LEIDAEKLRNYINEGVEARRSIDTRKIIYVSKILYDRLEKRGKLITFGNGGSAADAQHFAAELSGRFMNERKSLPAIALTTNSSSITAIGNDYGYSEVFSRQIEGLCNENDFVVGISTSGNSTNVVKGIERSRELGAFTLALTGRDGGKLARVAEECIKVDFDTTPIVQEAHISIIHMICYCLDELLR
jgi:D-sedoheptulose 7-phosphate isomerase